MHELPVFDIDADMACLVPCLKEDQVTGFKFIDVDTFTLIDLIFCGTRQSNCKTWVRYLTCLS